MAPKTDLTTCCPEFNPVPWGDQTFNWENKRFIRDKVFTVFYMPVNFGQAMKRLDRKVTAAGASVPDWLCLSDHTSKWNMDLYLAVDKDVQEAENTTISGNFYSRVYEGPFKDTGKWCKDLRKKPGPKDYPSKNVHVVHNLPEMCQKVWQKLCGGDRKSRIGEIANKR